MTVENGSYPSEDPTLLKDVPSEINVYKTKTIEPFKFYNFLRGKKGKSVEVGMGNIKEPDSFFKKISNYIRSNYFIPDARVGWNPYAIKRALEIIDQEDIQTVITTGPPHSSHLIGQFIKKKYKDNLTWIADFRDPWTSIYYEKYLNRKEKAKRLNQKYEDEVLQEADHVVVVSEGMKEEFKSRALNIKVIPNGYDGDDISIGSKIDSKNFVLSYIGNFKANQNIDTFWSALNELSSEIPAFKENFKLRITGNVNDEILQAIQSNNIDELVEMENFVPHHDAVIRMQSANLLYLPIPKSENNKSILTGKLFEYLASHTPILSLGPIDGDAADILRTSGRKEMIDYTDIQAIKDRIIEEYNYWLENGRQKREVESDAYKKYERKHLTQLYASIIHALND